MFVRNTARNERGVAYPSPLVMLTIIAIAMAGVAFLATRGGDAQEREITPVAGSATPTPSVTESAPAPTPTKKAPPPIKRGQVYVEVYNNTAITGLAGRIGQRATEAGWQVVGSDNWVGTIPATTVYYSPKLKRAGKQLALDLGIRRVQPAVEPMKLDRLTVILTGDLR